MYGQVKPLRGDSDEPTVLRLSAAVFEVAGPPRAGQHLLKNVRTGHLARAQRESCRRAKLAVFVVGPSGRGRSGQRRLLVPAHCAPDEGHVRVRASCERGGRGVGRRGAADRRWPPPAQRKFLPRRSLSRRLRLMASPSGFLVLAGGRRRASSSSVGREAAAALRSSPSSTRGHRRCRRLRACVFASATTRWRKPAGVPLCSSSSSQTAVVVGALCGCGTRTCPWCLPRHPWPG